MDKIKDYKEFVQEMSTVDRVNKEGMSVEQDGIYNIRIYSESLGNPTFHLEKLKHFEIVMQIKDLKIIETKHEKKQINKQDLKILLKWFDGFNKDVKMNNWDWLKYNWNKENPKYKIDYSKPNYVI